VTPQILLAVADAERRAIYEEFIQKERVNYQVVTSLRDVALQTSKQPFNGILLDMQLILRASRNEKYLVEDALRALPHIRLNITSKSKNIRMLASWPTQNKSQSSEEYLKFCCDQPPKLVLPRDRISININAKLSLFSDMASAVRTFSVDISKGGCFIFSVNDEITLQSHVWISFSKSVDPSPIPATVCWKREWGTTNDIPGIGVSFKEMTEEQHDQLIKLCEGTCQIRRGNGDRFW